MPKILIVEDEPEMRNGLRDNLEFEGYDVDVAETGPQGLEKIRDAYDLVILDVMLPGMSGFDVLKKARSEGVETAVLMLTAKGEEIDKVLGLELGADDYMTKPFSLRELLARVKARLRRDVKPKAEELPARVQIGRLEVDFQTYDAWLDEKNVSMTHKEIEVLRYLWQNRNSTVTRDNLLNDVWGYDEMITTRTIDNFILKLRQKIEENPGHPRIILTVHGSGYKMVI